MTRTTTYSEEETRTFGRTLARYLDPPIVVGFSGDLGSGKTAIVRGICEYFHCSDQVTSTTFTIIHEYEGKVPIVHCDLYRLETLEEIYQTGLNEIMAAEQITLIEWAERAARMLPIPRVEVACLHTDQEFRRNISWQRFETGMNTILFNPDSETMKSV